MTSAHSPASSGSLSLRSVSPSPSGCSPSASTSSDDSCDDASVDPTQRLIAELHGFERLLRSAYAAGGRVATAAAEAQAGQRLSLGAGHQVFAAISGAQQGVSEAIGKIAGGHRTLEALGRILGIETIGYGEVKPPRGSIACDDTDLRETAA